MAGVVEDDVWRFPAPTLAHHPFRHFTATDVLATEQAERLLEWLGRTDRFEARDTRFYRSSAFHISPDDVPPDASDFFTRRTFAAIRRIVSGAYEVPLDDEVMVSVNRYRPGQGTLIHTDYQSSPERDDFAFTHRFILYLNAHWEPSDGGVLGLFESPAATAPSVTVRPRHNTGVSLEIGPHSYHAVSSIRAGDRYSLNFTFRSTDTPRDRTVTP